MDPFGIGVEREAELAALGVAVVLGRLGQVAVGLAATPRVGEARVAGVKEGAGGVDGARALRGVEDAGKAGFPLRVGEAELAGGTRRAAAPGT